MSSFRFVDPDKFNNDLNLPQVDFGELCEFVRYPTYQLITDLLGFPKDLAFVTAFAIRCERQENIEKVLKYLVDKFNANEIESSDYQLIASGEYFDDIR